MKETIKNALILCAITLCAGLLLGGVYELTKKPRQEQEEKAIKNAYNDIFEEADAFKEIELDEENISKLLSDKGITQKNVVVDKCVNALNENEEIIGCIVSVTSKEGYGGNISFLVGFSTDKLVKGISILSINETAGLGLEAKNEDFLDQYISKGDLGFDNIDAISGATITTNAITKGVNAASIVADYLIEDVSENNNIENDTQDLGEGGSDE